MHIFILNTGIGALVYGAPILLIVLTYVVSCIEGYFFLKYLDSGLTVLKKVSFANLATTLLGIIITAIMVSNNFTIRDFLPSNFRYEHETVYVILVVVFLGLPNYLITVLVEFYILRKILAKNLALKDVLIANLISYTTLLITAIIKFTVGF